MKTLLLPLVACLCCSCATIKTISPDNNHVVIEHQGKKSYCETIPRIYSGISYNVCLLRGEPSKTANVGGTLNNVPWFVIDSAFSVVADTIVLPYTIVTQSKDGDIQVN
ncbi:YceK/YidQ family lipoprotein [Shewanella avicenniae]|uniref:YceK/YidQ family lipoprotein n=1 Tax=Shewanella avicenniae TaxID=2814294 RepID=A0ABX7QU80_9GAMM|nr:YceK/YidQ family lipoprotein [Shewanella avicenniae]QSX34540.1 YceK/YidQ family lipoprotein [Shewanella avicenniae]